VVAKQQPRDEAAGDLPVAAEVHRNAVVDDDRERGPQDRVRVRAGSIPVRENVLDGGLDDDAAEVVPGEGPQLAAEPLPIADGAGDEVLQGLSLYRHGGLVPLERVIARGQRPPHRRHLARIEPVGLLLTGVDDHDDRFHVRTP
jgi:hypothetical protein